MAATFHFTFFYFYRSRPINYAERIIDSCLSLQETHGLFSGNAVGQTCLDYDAIDLLAKASLLTRYRSVDVRDAMNKASDALLTLSNDDGGFVNCKQKIRHFNDRKHRLLRKVGLRRLVPASTRVKGTTLFAGNYCLAPRPKATHFQLGFGWLVCISLR